MKKFVQILKATMTLVLFVPVAVLLSFLIFLPSVLHKNKE